MKNSLLISTILGCLILFFGCAPKLQKNSDSPWHDIALLNGTAAATATLEEENDWSKYAVINLFDGKPDTCWAVHGNCIGEKIYFPIEDGSMEITFTNGYAKNQQIFMANNRIKVMTPYLLLGSTFEGNISEIGQVYQLSLLEKGVDISLKDQITPQKIKLVFDWKKNSNKKTSISYSLSVKSKNKLFYKYILCLEIKEIYDGNKYEDTCLSEIKVLSTHKNNINAKDIVGGWKPISGDKTSEFEEMCFDITDGVYGFATFAGGRIYYVGNWKLENGKLTITMSSDIPDREWIYETIALENNRLVLTDQTGVKEVYERLR